MEPVVIKMNQFGITLQLDPDVSFEDLIRKICEIFAENRTFFGYREIMLETTGRILSSDETSIIIQAIELNSDIKIVLINDNDEIKAAKTEAALAKFYEPNYFDECEIYRGNISKEQTITSDKSIIVLGDIRPKSKVIAKGNVIVMGSVLGEIHAGYPDNNECYVVAGTIESIDITIGTCVSEIVFKDKWSLRTRKNEEPTCIAVFNDELLAEPLSGGLIKKIKKEK